MSRITAAVVADVQFTHRGLGERFGGYDETEVDVFLDDIEAQMRGDAEQIAKAIGLLRRVSAGQHHTFNTTNNRMLAAAVLSVLRNWQKPAMQALPADQTPADIEHLAAAAQAAHAQLVDGPVT